MYNILICDDEQDIVNALKIYLMNPDFKRSHIALITFCRPYILLMVHSPPAFARGTSPKSRVQRRRCCKECISS